MDYSVLAQPFSAHSYWFSNLLCGMQEAAHRQLGTLRLMGEEDSFSPGEPVLLVGSDKTWMERAVTLVVSRGAIPCPVGACLPGSEQIGGIALDLEDAVLRCLSYLQHCGKRRVYFLGLSKSSLSDQVKYRAFCDAVGRGMLAGEAVFCQRDIESCVEAFAERTFSDTDAVLCANDTVALCLLAHPRIRAMRLPEQLFVVGMGNSFLSQYCALPLTTVEFDYRELGRQAIRAARFFVKTPVASRMRLFIPCRILVRESTQNIPLCEEKLAFFAPHLDLSVESGYFSGAHAEKIIALESLLQASDEVGRRIFHLLSRGVTYAQIAEEVGLTDRAVQYRVNTLCQGCGAKSGADLRTLLTRILRVGVAEPEEKDD